MSVSQLYHDQGYVRFQDEDSATPALEAARKDMDGKVIYNEAELDVTVLEGD